MNQDGTEQDEIFGGNSDSQQEDSLVESSKIDRLHRENLEVAKIISVQRFTPTTQKLTEALFNPIVKQINELVEAAELYASFLIKRRNPVQEDDDDDYVPPTILTKQPTILKNGILKDYQLESLNWLIALYECGINGILADEMGLGKTVQVISLIGYLRQYKGVNKHFLIVAPKSTLGNWILEFQKWLPDCRVIKLVAVVEQRETIIRDYLQTGKFDVCVTSFEGVVKCFNHLKKYKFKYLIVDEAHKLKNDLSQNHIILKSLNTQYKLFLTGTPLQNNPHELWSLLNFLLPDLFHSSDVFDQWFEVQAKSMEENLSQAQVTHKNQELVVKFQRVLRPFMMRRTKLEVEKELPLKKEIQLYIQMTKHQRDIYRKILLNEKIDDMSKSFLYNKLMQLRKVCLHPYLFPEIEDLGLPPLGEHIIEQSGKMKLLDVFLKKLHKEGHQVLLFSQFTTMLNIIEDFCEFRKYSYCRIDGSTELVLREEQIADFTSINSEKFIFLLSTRAGGLGINLASADRGIIFISIRVILFDSDFNPQMDLQAMDRAHRIGQKNPVLVYRFVCKNTIEEKIIERQQVKLRWDKMMIQQGIRTGAKTILSKDEVKDIIAHGAQQIFADNEEWTDQDIEEILKQGEILTLQLKENIDKQMGIVTNDSSGFDLGLKSINLFAFHADDKLEKDKQILTAKKKEFHQQIRKQQAKPTVLKDFLIPVVIESFQLYPDEELLIKLKEKENAYKTYLDLLEKEIPITDEAPPDLNPSERDKLDSIIAHGFPDWTSEDYRKFVQACEKYGRSDIEQISIYVGKPRSEVQRYSEQFFKHGVENNQDPDYFLTSVINQIEKMETKLEKIKESQALVNNFLSNCSNDLDMLILDEQFYKLQQIEKSIYTQTFDKLLLLGIQKQGYNNWVNIKDFVLSHPLHDHFNFTLKYITETEVQARIVFLVKILQSTNEKNSKKKLSNSQKNTIQEMNVEEQIKDQELASVDNKIKEEKKKGRNQKPTIKEGQIVVKIQNEKEYEQVQTKVPTKKKLKQSKLPTPFIEQSKQISIQLKSKGLSHKPEQQQKQIRKK